MDRPCGPPSLTLNRWRLQAQVSFGVSSSSCLIFVGRSASLYRMRDITFWHSGFGVNRFMQKDSAASTSPTPPWQGGEFKIFNLSGDFESFGALCSFLELLNRY